MPTRSAASRFSLLALALAAIAVVWAPAWSLAQTSPVEPHYVATARDGVPLKSGDMDGYYNVAVLGAGQVLWVDAEGSGWARVAFPPGRPVYARAQDVEKTEDENFVRVARVTTLKSPNAAAGFAQSWQRAIPRGMESELPIGSRLRVFEAVTGGDGSVVGYLVEAPPPVRAYVKVDHLRPANDGEIAAYLESMPAAEPEVGDMAAEEGGDSETPDTEAPVEEQPAPDAGGDTSLLEEQVPQGQEPQETEPAMNEPVAEQGQIDEPSEEAQPVDLDPAAGRPGVENGGVTEIHQGEATPEARRVGTLRDLAEAFNQVQSQPAETAELDELAAEFRRTIAAQGDDAASLRIRQALQERLRVLEMRIDLRNTRRELQSRREQISQSTQSVTSRVRELERSRGYEFVGRLVQSSVYDGRRLPLMYRIVSISGMVPRTIGYVNPDAGQGLGLQGKLGEIVGILGDAQFDEALQLRIVRPTRVDVLSAESVLEPGQ